MIGTCVHQIKTHFFFFFFFSHRIYQEKVSNLQQELKDLQKGKRHIFFFFFLKMIVTECS